MRLVLPMQPSPTSTHLTLRSAAAPKRLFTADDRSLLRNLLGGTGGTAVPGAGLYSPPPWGGIAEDTVRPAVSEIHLTRKNERAEAPVSDFSAASIYLTRTKVR